MHRTAYPSDLQKENFTPTTKMSRARSVSEHERECEYQCDTGFDHLAA
jgi:hypothetical protein